MRNTLKWAIFLVSGCIGCMILFNVIPTDDPTTKETYRSYANYAFDTLKVLFGIIIGALTEKFHNHQAVQSYQQTIKKLEGQKPQDNQKRS